MALSYSLATLPREDPAVYDMLCAANSIGVFQVESRAQMNMLPRLRPRCFYDLVIEVAIVRPGPIQGDMVHPYLRRRDRLEPESYPAPHPDFGPPDELRQVLGRTKGVPLFQEQAMRLAMVAAQFSPGELNELRRAMATFRRRGTIGDLEQKMVSRMVARGYEPDFAHRCFSQIRGFGEYGFPESHAASFAHLVYVSSWLKCHYPAVFAAALLNSQPMGFYAPAQIVRDAREHGVEVRHPDVNRSGWDSGLESGSDSRSEAPALRLGLREVVGLKEDDGRAIAKRPEGGLCHHRRPAAPGAAFPRRSRNAGRRRCLSLAGASIGAPRSGRSRDWPRARPLPLFAALGVDDQGTELSVALPDMPPSEHVVNDYQTITDVAQRPSDGFPAREMRTRRSDGQSPAQSREGRRLRIGCRRRAGAPAPGHRQGGRLHNPRG